MPPKYERAAEKAAAAWLAAGLYACFIFAVSAVPRIPVPASLQLIHGDWIFHVLEYAVFGFLLARAFDLSVSFPSAVSLALTAIAAGVFYATTDEFHQKFVAGRDSSLADGIADSAGVVAGVVAWLRHSKFHTGK